jgi:hypothetical protein
MANRAKPTYDGLVETARQAAVNGMDETGWKVGGRLQWLHVAVSARVTVLRHSARTGICAVGSDSGTSYDEFLIHDGWVPYLRLPVRVSSKLLGASAEALPMPLVASPAAAAFPRTWTDLKRPQL